MIESRENNVTNKPFVSTQALEMYSEESNSSIYFLILQSIGTNLYEICLSLMFSNVFRAYILDCIIHYIFLHKLCTN